MSETSKSLVQILKTPEAERLRDIIAAKARSAALDGLGHPEKALRFARVNLRGSYLFGRFLVPSYGAAAFASLTDFHPADDEVGTKLRRVMEAVQGELFNNNIYERPGECHSHYHDALHAYVEASGDASAKEEMLKLEGRFFEAASASALWSEGSIRYARNMLRCCKDVLTLFILMPANEEMAPTVYARALASLSVEGRFDAFRRFLERHVALDEDDHGPVALDWLELYLRKAKPSPARVQAATESVITLFTGR